VSASPAESAALGAELTSDVLRHAYGMFPSGVTAVCALIDSAPVGLAASSFTSVSIEPPLVSLCVAHTSSTWPVLRTASRLGISVLAAEHGEIVRSLSAKTGDRFAEVAWEADPAGGVFVHGSTLWLDCEIDAEIRAGDHDIVVLRVHSLQPYPDIAPMVFHASKFRELAS
jgi:flavin reductase (DIM6/NTAB) family NADH-FMN oxidoreductase RutF